MRKQTKLVAVLSAAALLAIGASMTSFAAWQKSDDGTWQYFDRDGEMVSGEWQKDGAKWFYLDDDGNMATDMWVDDDKYVGEDGAMLANTWKKTLADETVDDPDDDGESWYYFSSKGQKTTGDKKIGGKTYYFDDEGKMRDGWWEDNSGTSTYVYYLGDEDDGARKSGWLWLETPEGADVTIGGHTDDDICESEGWYYFDSNGKMYNGTGQKKVNGKYYYFNAHGQMLYQWVNNKKVTVPAPGTPSNAQADGKATPSNTEAGNMLYMNAVEEGWRADGWYEIDGAEDTGTDSDTDWYYFKDGKAKKADMVKSVDLVDGFFGAYGNSTPETNVWRARIKVSGKWFCFNEMGQMQTGLEYIPANGGGFYYFDENGYMKTGKVSGVEEDNDSFTYYFDTKNGKLGKGVTGEKSGYLYYEGKRLEADDDYRVYGIPTSKTNIDYYLVNKSGKLQKSKKKYVIENSNVGANAEVDFETFMPSSGYKLNAVGAAAVASYADIPYIYLYDGQY